MEADINLSESMEDYLEAIYNLIKENGSARVTDIANHLKIAASSVNQGLKKLNQEGLISQEKYGPIKLTESGLKAAEKVRCKHRMLYLFLHKTLGVSQESADHDACRIEHALSEEERSIVKQADALCAYLKCLEELSAGNNEFLLAKTRLEKTLESRRSEEMDYFMQVFVPSFHLSLDEISQDSPL